MLQVVEHRPAVHHGQPHVEDDRVRPVLVREREPGVAAQGDEPLEAAPARDVQHGLRELGVVLDDQHDPVAGVDLVAVVGHLARSEELRIARNGRKRPAVPR